MNVYIYFNQEHNVLICKVHQYAVSFKFLVHHFLQKHDLDIKICQGIVNYASQFTTMEPGHLLYSSEKVIPVLYLDIVDVFQCKYDACNKTIARLIMIGKLRTDRNGLKYGCKYSSKDMIKGMLINMNWN